MANQIVNFTKDGDTLVPNGIVTTFVPKLYDDTILIKNLDPVDVYRIGNFCLCSISLTNQVNLSEISTGLCIRGVPFTVLMAEYVDNTYPLEHIAQAPGSGNVYFRPPLKSGGRMGNLFVRVAIFGVAT